MEQAVYERVHSPRSSWIVRVSHTDAEDLRFRGTRTQDLRDGRIRDIRAARVDALEIGMRASSRGASAFYVEAGAGLSRTRLDGVAVLSMPEFAFLLERRVALQWIGGVDVGHVWQPVRFPLGVLAEIGWRTRGAPLAGSQVSAKIGLLGQHASP